MTRLKYFSLLLIMVAAGVANGIFAAPPPPFDYGNGWVDPAKPWIKLRVWEDGVYRVTAQELAQAGLDTNSVNPDNLHLFYRGKEQFIHVEATAGRVSFMEFMGKRNDGRIDSTMYRDPYSGTHGNDLMPNKRLSIFSDTSAYFLTWDNTPGLRYADFYQNDYQNFSPEPHFRNESYFEYHPSQYNFGYHRGGGAQYDVFQVLNSNYITGQGSYTMLFCKIFSN